MNKEKIENIWKLKEYEILCYDKKQVFKVFNRLEKLGFNTKYNDNNSTSIYCDCMTFENLTGLQLTYEQNNMPFISYEEFLKVYRKFIKNKELLKN